MSIEIGLSKIRTARRRAATTPCKRHLLFLLGTTALCAGAAHAQTLPPSESITDIDFHLSTLTSTAPGNGARAPESDNWVITWGTDDHQYTSFGDGQGFGTNDNDRASLGVARIEGGKRNYSAFDVFKTNTNVGPGWSGKSYGILDIDGTLWMWRAGQGSETGAYLFSGLYRSDNKGVSWVEAGVEFDSSDFSGPQNGAVVPTFLQYGRGYSDAPDNFVYSYFYEDEGDGWNVQVPGRIMLARVPQGQMQNEGAYEWFAGLNGNNPTWSTSNNREPVFTDSVNGVMRTSVSYNKGLQKYLLVTQQVDRFRSGGARIGIYESDTPWGPWFTVLFADPWSIGLQSTSSAGKTVYWNFSNKWLSQDGRDFVLVYTGDGEDEWGTVEGTFVLGQAADTRPLPPSDLNAE